MMASDFQAKLRKCNPKLKIFCGNDDTKLAGVASREDGQWVTMVGIDKNWVPEYPTVDDHGRILKSGWRRAMRSLIFQKLVDRRKAEKVFGTQFIGVRMPSITRTFVDPLNKAIEKATVDNLCKFGKPILHKDEIMDFSRAIVKRDKE